MVSSGWLAQHLGVNPRYAVGFQGNGQMPGSVALAVNAIVSGAADYVLVHRALHNPAGRYHGNPMQQAAGSMQWTAPQGYFGPLAMIGLPYNEYLQRYGASPRGHGGRARRGPQERSPHPVVVLARPPAHSRASTSTRPCSPIRSAGSTATSRSTARPPSSSPRRSGPRTSRTPRSTSPGYASGSPTRHRLPLHWPLDDIYETGAETARRLWQAAGVGPGEVDLPQLYDGFSPFVYFWLEVLGFCPVGEAHRFVQDGGIDSDCPSGLPVLSGGGALGNGRMHGVPQMLECYLQLSGRAGDRQRARRRRSVSPATPHRTSVARSSTAPPSSDEVRALTSTVVTAPQPDDDHRTAPAIEPSIGPAARMLGAGRRLIAAKGSDFTTQDLIQEAGVALQTFYRYFGGKDQLLLALIGDLIGEHCAALAATAQGITDPVARLEIYVRSTLAPLHTTDQLAAARFITSEHWRLHETHPQEVWAATQPVTDLICTELKSGVAAGSLVSCNPDRDAWLMTKTIIGAYHHLAFQPDDPAKTTIADDVWSFCLAAAGGRPRS